MGRGEQQAGERGLIEYADAELLCPYCMGEQEQRYGYDLPYFHDIDAMHGVGHSCY